MKSPHEFYLETDGRIIDVDGYYGGQCWDLFAFFTLEWINRTFSCIATGYVIDFWTHFDEIGLGEYFVKVPNNQLQDGDWAIWQGPCPISDSSHIAMFRCNNGDTGTGVFLTQNPGGNPNYTHQMDISYAGLVGGLRPKCYIPKPTLPNPVEENKQVDQLKVNCNDTMRVRLGHNLDAEIIGFAKEGYYNVLQKCEETDYIWCEVETDKWLALYPPYCEYIPKMQETPQNSTNDENNTIIPKQPETPKNEPNNEEIEHNDNIFIKIIKFIIELIQKIFKKEN